MEYPTVTVIGRSGNARTLERVIVHEVGHNWFQAIIATDERRYPWMDEGINSYYENRYFEEKYPGSNLMENTPPVACRLLGLCNLKHTRSPELTYKISSSAHNDQPIGVHSEEATELNYGTMFYAKASAAVKHLAKALGQEDFDKVMKSYYEKFSFKHPGPDDISAHFNSESNKYLDWFFDDILETTKTLDYKISSILSEDKTIGSNEYTQIYVKNKGDINGPFPISAIKGNEVVHTIWYNGFLGESEVLFPKMDADAYKLDALYETIDDNRQNNTYKTKGLFKGLEPIKLQPFASINTGENTLINLLPTLHYNVYDGVGLGLHLHSGAYPFRDFEFSFRPMIGLTSKEMIGTGHFAYWLHPSAGPFEHIKLFLDTESFNHAEARAFDLSDPELNPKPTLLEEPWRYDRYVPGIKFYLKKATKRSPKSSEITLRHINVVKEKFPTIEENTDASQPKIDITESYYINHIGWLHKNSRAINAYSFGINAYQGSNFIESTLEAKTKFNYGRKNKGLYLRLFADIIPYRKDGTFDNKSRISPNGDGDLDYLLDEYYYARNNLTSESRQIGSTGLGFKALFIPQLIDQWALNFTTEADIPKVPLKLYADVMFFDQVEGSTTYETPLAFTTGIAISVLQDIVRINFPIASDASLKMIDDTNRRTYWEKITFSFNPRKLGKWSDIRNLIQL